MNTTFPYASKITDAKSLPYFDTLSDALEFMVDAVNNLPDNVDFCIDTEGFFWSAGSAVSPGGAVAFKVLNQIDSIGLAWGMLDDCAGPTIAAKTLGVSTAELTGWMLAFDYLGSDHDPDFAAEILVTNPFKCSYERSPYEFPFSSQWRDSMDVWIEALKAKGR